VGSGRMRPHGGSVTTVLPAGKKIRKKNGEGQERAAGDGLWGSDGFSLPSYAKPKRVTVLAKKGR